MKAIIDSVPTVSYPPIIADAQQWYMKAVIFQHITNSSQQNWCALIYSL